MQGIARLWRVAHFVLDEFLQLELHREGTQPALYSPTSPPLASVLAKPRRAVVQCNAETQTQEIESQLPIHDSSHLQANSTSHHSTTQIHSIHSNLPSASSGGSSLGEDGTSSSYASIDPALDEVDPVLFVPRVRETSRLQRAGDRRGPCLDAVTGTYTVASSQEEGDEAFDDSAYERAGEFLAGSAPRQVSSILSSSRDSSGLGNGSAGRIPRRSSGQQSLGSGGGGQDVAGAPGRVSFDISSPIAAAAASSSTTSSPASVLRGLSNTSAGPVSRGVSNATEGTVSRDASTGRVGSDSEEGGFSPHHTGSLDTAFSSVKFVLNQEVGSHRAPVGVSAPVLTQGTIPTGEAQRGSVGDAAFQLASQSAGDAAEAQRREQRHQQLLQRTMSENVRWGRQNHVLSTSLGANEGIGNGVGGRQLGGSLTDRESWPLTGQLPSTSLSQVLDSPAARQAYKRMSQDGGTIVERSSSSGSNMMLSSGRLGASVELETLQEHMPTFRESGQGPGQTGWTVILWGMGNRLWDVRPYYHEPES